MQIRSGHSDAAVAQNKTRLSVTGMPCDPAYKDKEQDKHKRGNDGSCGHVPTFEREKIQKREIMTFTQASLSLLNTHTHT